MKCTCGNSTKTPSNCGTSTVVCTVTTRHPSLNNIGCHQLVQQLHLWDLDKFFVWSKVTKLFEETKMSISDMTISIWTPSLHACKARRGHILQTAYADSRFPNNQDISCVRDVVVERVNNDGDSSLQGLWAPAPFRIVADHAGTTSLPRDIAVAMHTGQLGLRIQGLPLPGHHTKLTRHASCICGGVVDGNQLRIPRCEEDNLEALGEFIATAAVGHLTEKTLGENRRLAGEVVSSVGDTRHLRACSVTRLVLDIK